jgi:hypothetical protein
MVMDFVDITNGELYWFVTNLNLSMEKQGKTAPHETDGKILILRVMHIPGTHEKLLT